jgi:hypothetical protein
MRRSLVMLALVFTGGLAFAGCAFTNNQGQPVIDSPAGVTQVQCITPAGCTGPTGQHFNNGDMVPVTCSPNYSPCVPVSSDVDCAGGSGDGPMYVLGPIHVLGQDIYGLDSDGDGVGCQS